MTNDRQTSKQSPYEAVEARLIDQRGDWERRLQAIQVDRRRQHAPLDPDFGDQAIERENDATLDALDARGRQELVAIEAALERIAEGTYGTCTKCVATIPIERLRAQPTASTCLACAEAPVGPQ